MAKLSDSSSAPATRRKSYLLSVTPIDYSLTEGTNIPAPDNTPPRSPAADIAPPPTPGRGPLNSHPATDYEESSHMDLVPQPSREKENGHSPPAARVMSSDGNDSLHTTTSPPYASSPPQARRPSGVRKLLSLSNLRNSFSSSRTSLAIPRSSNDTYSTQHTTPYNSSMHRPSSPSMMSTTASSIGQSQQQMPPPPLRKRKSNGNWFKRKSSLFLLNGNGELDSVAEDSGNRPDTRESKRMKSSGGGETVIHRVPPERKTTPPPLIPEIGQGSFSGGDLGWDESSFRR